MQRKETFDPRIPIANDIKYVLFLLKENGGHGTPENLNKYACLGMDENKIRHYLERGCEYGFVRKIPATLEIREKESGKVEFSEDTYVYETTDKGKQLLQ